MQQQYFNHPLSRTPPSESDLTPFQSLPLDPIEPDCTSLLSDKLLLKILSKLPVSQHVSNSLSVPQSHRFRPRSCLYSDAEKLWHISDPQDDVDTNYTLDGFLGKTTFLPSNEVDQGLTSIAEKYPNLQRLVATGASEQGLIRIAAECCTLQELELHYCGDLALKGLSGIKNLQVVKLIGFIDGFYNSVISDIGLTQLARGCKRLVKLELCGCEGSYDGIKAIGQCCQMLEELSFYDHRMDGGWLAGLSFCENLKTLMLKSCKSIDESPGVDELLGSCLTLEELQLERCQIRDKQSVKALFLVCENVRAIAFQNCWGLDNDVFSLASICRRVKLLSLEGCSLLTIKGLESVVLSWKGLQQLRVVSCNNIKDSEITPELATLFSVLKELKWRPDSRSLLSSNLAGTGMGNRGGRFFKRSRD
ncbi:hypothetical protein V6N13_128545 [Hibiscus sabdariffa]|uniref:F-box protein n=1 Tax=Hibiscus sabdariffa TaxID=183260 RepID=A0ABR2P0G7_9ROSI